MTTFAVKGMYGSLTPVNTTMSESQLEEWLTYPAFVLESATPVADPVIRYRTCEGCERCKTDAYVPHYNCIYQGRAMGHNAAHCTADSCY